MSRVPPIVHGVRERREGSNVIEELDLEFANGERRHYHRFVAQGPGAVIVVPMLDADTCVLVREYAAGVGRYEIGPVKGAIDPGEGVEAAADRELKEEAGYGARALQVIRTLSHSPSYMTHQAYVVLARDLYEERLIGDEPEELERVPWKLSELDRLVQREDVSDGRGIAALFIVREWLRQHG